MSRTSPMFPTRRTLALAALVVAGSAAIATAAPPVDGQPNGRTCATAEPTRVEREHARAAVQRFRAERSARTPGGTIRVAFHVITSGDKGQVSDAQIAAQIDELNR